MANDFTNDASCISLWNFEPGNLTTDSKGTNTLSIGSGTPASDAVVYKEGTGSLSLNGSSHYTITDTNLSANFPLKYGVGGYFTICCWFYLNTTGFYLFNKLTQIQTGNFFGAWPCFILGDRRVDLNNQNNFTTGRWYHFAAIGYIGGTNTSFVDTITYDSSNSTWIKTSHTGITVVPTTGVWDIGKGDYGSGGGKLNGKLDEFIVFNKMISSKTLSDIRRQTHPLLPENNVFTNDDSCLSVWNHETASITDDKGYLNLDEVNTPHSINIDTRFVTSGVKSTYCYGLNNVWYYLEKPDANLANDFPFKSNGSAKIFSFLTWFFVLPDGSNYEGDLLSKYNSNDVTTVNSGFQCHVNISAGTGERTGSIDVRLGTGAATMTFNTGLSVTSHYWYHIAFLLDGSAPSLKVVLYNGWTGVSNTYTATPASQVASNSESFKLGGASANNKQFHGYIDQSVFFNRLITDDEITEIRNGTFGIGGIVYKRKFPVWPASKILLDNSKRKFPVYP